MKTKMMKAIYATVMMLFFISSVFAQGVGINDNGSNPNTSAILDVSSTTKGFLPPRMTTAQRNTITSPAEGLVIYNTEEKTLNIFNGTSWSLINPVVCGQSFTDTRDGKVYPTVQIGSQCWMAKNLNIGTRVDGSVGQINNGIIEKYCYDNLEANCVIYGGLYKWNEMMQFVTTAGVQGICPTGWHIPTDAEWTIVSTFLGGTSVAGGKMKSTGTIEAGTGLWNSPNIGATNESGFTAVPAGYCSDIGQFLLMGSLGYWWSSSEYDANFAWSRYMHYFDSSVASEGGYEDKGFSVRCLQNF